jgi:hypothetical protein
VFHLVVARLHIRKEQLLEGGLYLGVIATAVLGPALRRYAMHGKRKKIRHPWEEG